MLIAVVNESDRKASEVREVVTALHHQLKHDFGKAWSIKCAVKYMGKEQLENSKDIVTGICYLKDKPKPRDEEGLVGYHDKNAANGISLGYVFQDVAEELGEHYSVTMSHELLEMALNRHVNYWALGPHPTENRTVFHWLEACDACQSRTKKVKGTDVLASDFLLPLYFTAESDGNKGCNDFLKSKDLESFGILPGGYFGFFDPKTRREETFFANAESKRRYAIKSRMGKARRKKRLDALVKTLKITGV